PALEADAVCLSLPAPQAGQLLTGVEAILAAALQDIRYASSAIVNIACKRADVAHPLHGMGFVVPAVEKRAYIACSFSSVKFAARAPQDQVLLTAFVGEAMQPAQLVLTDTEVQRAVYQDLRQLLGSRGEPRAVTRTRRRHAMPQNNVGPLTRR